MQFTSAYRKLIARCGASTHGHSGNVTAQDSTEIHCGSVTTHSPVTFTRSDDDAESVVNGDDIIELETVPLNLQLQNILVYITGFVVKRLLINISCDVCRLAMVEQGNTSELGSHQFIHLRNNGGLVIPSHGVISIVNRCEQYLRSENSMQRDQDKVVKQLQILLMNEFGSRDVLNLGHHIIESADGLDNHYFDILKQVPKLFHKIRTFHLVKQKNLQLNEISIRHKLNKTVLFLNQ